MYCTSRPDDAHSQRAPSEPSSVRKCMLNQSMSYSILLFPSLRSLVLASTHARTTCPVQAFTAGLIAHCMTSGGMLAARALRTRSPVLAVADVPSALQRYAEPWKDVFLDRALVSSPSWVVCAPLRWHSSFGARPDGGAGGEDAEGGFGAIMLLGATR